MTTDIIQRAPAPGSTAISKHTSKSLSQAEIIRLDRLMLKTIVYYPNQEIAVETQTEFRAAFESMAVLYGIDLLETAVQKTRLTHKFFPHPAEINEAILEAQELERAKGRWERQEDYMRKKAAREQEEAASTEYVDMGAIVKAFYEKKGVVEVKREPVAQTFPDPHDRVMASFSLGLTEGKEYEPKVVEEIMAWRQAKGVSHVSEASTSGT
jgi:hypothetical protein